MRERPNSPTAREMPATVAIVALLVSSFMQRGLRAAIETRFGISLMPVGHRLENLATSRKD